MENIIWAQARVFFNTSETSLKDIDEYITIRRKTLLENKFKILKLNILPLRDYLKSNYSDKWHFLGVYEKDKNLYLDIRFRIPSVKYKDFIVKVNHYLRDAKENRIICEIKFDDKFYKKYKSRFNDNQIAIILDSLELFCDKLIESISSDVESFKIQANINKEMSIILGELCHLVLFQAGISDTPFHLLEAFNWSGIRNIIDLLINDLIKNPSFKIKIDSYLNGQYIPNIKELIIENMSKY